MKLANIIKNNNLINEKEWLKHIETLNKNKQKLNFKREFIKSIKKRLPKAKFGILFSGGIDSTLIAFICRKLKADFVCYTVGLKNSPDIISAEKVAKKHGFKLKKKILTLKDIEKTIKTVAGITGPDTMKVGVGSVMYEAIKLAKKDNVNILFSGLGAEEIFAGYERHSLSKDINKECWSGLKRMHKRDFKRDFAIAKELKANLLVPFLEPNVITAAMQIPGKEKIKKQYKKYALRKTAEKIGLKDAWRKKKAAQYGSYFDKAIKKLAKKNKFKFKKNYLNSLFNIGALVSSGKDSIYALYLMKKQGYNVKCIITLKSRNPDSFMFHTPTVDMAKLQSKAIGIPLIKQKTAGEKEKELIDLKKALKLAKEKYNIQGISTGALFSNYQKERIEKTASSIGLKVFTPLWHMDQETEVREILNQGFKFILTKVSADGLDKTWLDRIIIGEDVDKLVKLNEKIRVNISFEGGEAETLMIDGPIFNKKIEIKESEIKEENKHIAELIIKKAELMYKNKNII